MTALSIYVLQRQISHLSTPPPNRLFALSQILGDTWPDPTRVSRRVGERTWERGCRSTSQEIWKICDESFLLSQRGRMWGCGWGWLRVFTTTVLKWCTVAVKYTGVRSSAVQSSLKGASIGWVGNSLTFPPLVLDLQTEPKCPSFPHLKRFAFFAGHWRLGCAGFALQLKQDCLLVRFWLSDPPLSFCCFFCLGLAPCFSWSWWTAA